MATSRNTMLSEIRPAIAALVVFTAITGLAYPLAMTAVSQLVFPHRANGSLITQEGRTVGSELIGQPFDDPKYFWSRPSATAPHPYNAGASSGSNLSVTNPSQMDAIMQRAAKLRAADPTNEAAVPIDLVTASGSGLDPHISVAAARWQIARVARTRGLEVDAVTKLVEKATTGRQFGVLGEPVVNVLRLNLSLDEAASSTQQRVPLP